MSRSRNWLILKPRTGLSPEQAVYTQDPALDACKQLKNVEVKLTALIKVLEIFRKCRYFNGPECNSWQNSKAAWFFMYNNSAKQTPIWAIKVEENKLGFTEQTEGL